jgi:hypothetical protein
MAKFTLHLRGHVVGYLALFVALGGTAYAATAAKNSVTSITIKNGQVKAADLGKGSVTTAKLNDATEAPNADRLDGVDSSAFLRGGGGAVTSADLAAGTVGVSKFGTIPAARVHLPENSVASDSSLTTVALCFGSSASSTDFDTEGLDSQGTCPAGQVQKFVAPVAGSYVVAGYVSWNGNLTGSRRLDLITSGGTAAHSDTDAGLGAPSQAVSGIVHLDKGGTAELKAGQNSGSSLNFASGSFSIGWLGP